MKNCWKVGVVVSLLIIVLCGCGKTYGEQQYDKAVTAVNNGNYWEAYSLLKTLKETGNEFNDSIQLMNDIKEKAFAENRQNAYLGGTIYLGAYEQDGNTANGKEDIEWYVLKQEDNQMLVLSVNALDYQPFATTGAEATWADSYIRKWLNNTFLDEAFTAEEKSIIANSLVSADTHPDYSKWGVDPGEDTQDEIFLLSAREFERAYLRDYARDGEKTRYVGNKIQESASSDASNSWWLRTPSISYRHISAVNSEGEEYSVDIFTFEGMGQRPTEALVRPAMWITID